MSLVLRLVNALLAGRLPHLAALFDSRLFAVRKRGGGPSSPSSRALLRLRERCGACLRCERLLYSAA
jgi:hypothetical protein